MSTIGESSNPLSRFMSDESNAINAPSGPERSHVGEVVESSNATELVAEARQLHGAPSFGQFVRVDSEVPIVGIVFNVFTHSIEPNRRPTAYGKTEDELRLEQPQIFELLRTEFQALVIGYLTKWAPCRSCRRSRRVFTVLCTYAAKIKFAPLRIQTTICAAYSTR